MYELLLEVNSIVDLYLEPGEFWACIYGPIIVIVVLWDVISKLDVITRIRRQYRKLRK